MISKVILAKATNNALSLWERKCFVPYSDENGFVAEFTLDPETGLQINKITTTVSHSIQTILSVLTDIRQRQNFDPVFEQGQVLENVDEFTEIIYARLKSPNLLSSQRDLVAIGSLTYVDGAVFLTLTSIRHASMPPQKGVQRAQLTLQSWILKPLANRETQITLINSINMMGFHQFIPSSTSGLVNDLEKVKGLCTYLDQKFLQ